MPRSKAGYYRHHRKCMELAQEMGCTPADAELWLKQTEERERHRARCAAKGFRSQLPPIPKPSAEGRSFERWDAPHMMRN